MLIILQSMMGLTNSLLRQVRQNPVSSSASGENKSVLNLNGKQNYSQFTIEEIQRIQKVWKNAKDREVTMQLLVAVIIQKPQFATLFRVEFTTESKLLKCTILQDHSAKIANFIDNIVNSLDVISVEEIRKMLYNVGVNHYQKNVNFTAENYMLFKNMLIEKICQGVDEETTAAWFKLLGIIVREMKNGFHGESAKSSKKVDDNFK